ncbi:type IV pilus assembly protein PilB [Synechococcus elongatus PCC 6301]|uniref:Type IV pilus assembly protein PilB n=1 Tax=Synechococcus sp. (strain ATCC 27144 / PCC 6301 / SAUG 1402/1) TaxID=269084 RepID=A0A0H3K4M8_SYNP6|nr:GspE/PulE family protein [Synechococcus elongatus]BAD80212.1 type IV pilus assembly protein PilB [Synechococcus elongatus PCC 6301]
MPDQPISPRYALIALNQFSSFGNKLVQAGFVDPEQLQTALVESRRSGQSLPQVISALTGQSLPPELMQQYRRQQLFELKILHGVESLNPDQGQYSEEVIHELIADLVPIETCRRHQLVPLERHEAPPRAVVAMVDPNNLDALDELNRLLRPRGYTLQRLVITLEDHERLIAGYLDQQLERQQAMQAKQLGDFSEELANLDNLELTEISVQEEDLAKALQEADDAPIVSLANKILLKALTEGASDIHVEPQEDGLRVRLRRDGVLHQEFGTLPKKIQPALTSRLKIMANLDIAERRVPQDGRIRRMFQGRKIDFRVNSLPSHFGEKICMRLLDNSATQLGLDQLITDEEALALVRDMGSRPYGLILVTGPTGSGKSTSLYSLLAERNDPAININTAEDPIEYTLPGLTQVQVLREKGMNFASILRAFMRQDPDVILVGETRDLETARTAIEAALTGHLVLTTLHANDAPSAIARLSEMGVEPYLVSGSLIGVVSQRLMRRVCPDCRVPYTPNPEELGRYGLSASQELDVTFYKAKTLTSDSLAQARSQGQVCRTCRGTGYKGRVGVYEVMRVNEVLQVAINQGLPTERLKEIAVEQGMKTLLSYSLELVRQGYTTFEEVDRVTFTDSGVEAELKAKRKLGLTCNACGAGLQPEWLDCPYCLTPRFGN